MTARVPEFWIDVGGTFTDCLLRTSVGPLRRAKVLSSGITKGCVTCGDVASFTDRQRCGDGDNFWNGYQLRLLDAHGQIAGEATVAAFDSLTGVFTFTKPLPTAPRDGQAYELSADEDAPLLAIRRLLGLQRALPIPPCVVRLGTTRGTNALLTRTGARTALVTTRGFADVLEIGNQNRPKLFARAIQKRTPLYAAVIEIDERVAADGTVLTVPDEVATRRQLAALRAQGIESLAICLLHAYRQPVHELMVESWARAEGFHEISLSNQVAPLAKIVARGDTTVLDAYLNPVLRTYVARLQTALGAHSSLRLMTSAGTLVSAAEFRGRDSLLSGPAGGVVGFSRAAQACGLPRAIGFDMGGTSTDVARFEGRYEREYETEKAGVRVVAPLLAIETVAAGGGSICRFDGVKLVVGPESAGATPGPACYGRGGPLTVTDLNFYLGKIPSESFPFPLHQEPVEAQLQALCATIVQATGRSYTPATLCDGFLQVANAVMVRAVQAISLAKGYDPRDYALVAFGGAGGQHACAVAHELGITQVLNHPEAGVLSAYGIGQAEVARQRTAAIYRPLDAVTMATIAATCEALIAAARDEVLAEGVVAERLEVQRSLELRYRGLDATLVVDEPQHTTWGCDAWATAYTAAHQRLYGYCHHQRPIEVVAARIEVVGREPQPVLTDHGVAARTPEPERLVTVWFEGQPRPTPLFARAALRPGDVVSGPAIVREEIATTVIDPGWTARVLAGGELLLVATPATASHAVAKTDIAIKDAATTEADPVRLEIFNHQFAAIAERMGITLRNTAGSVNVKERLDFSCALFTARGELVVNAPHIPVHLGAMGETVRQLLAEVTDLRAGDVIVTNDPYRGGSHLPDVTVITPVHDPASGALRFFTASRAHHAEIGGTRPGSMPPFSRTLAEEGVLIRWFRLVAAGEPRYAELGALLQAGPYPTRSVAENLADVTAQVAANHQGAGDLQRLVEQCSWPTVEAYMGHIQRAAEQKVRAALARLTPGRRSFVDHLDDGTPIAVTIDLAAPDAADGVAARFDFTGTGPVASGNLNANRAIVTAAVMYCLRLLIDEDIPLNEGVLAPVRITLPAGLLNPPEGPTPEQCPAIVGGNVETSQRVVDVLLGALELTAASQGTMNNLLFGDTSFGYYETICGGSGATADQAGAAAVHTHMTNTRLTDPEVLELRYPVRLRAFTIRRGSGGAGEQRGGDGIVRQIEFLRSLDVSILSQRRGPYAPYGMQGGEPGACGQNSLTRAGGRAEALPALAQLRVEPGDVLEIATPGGGGWGKKC